ncbi:unnamed protein product [Symbiodinium pilosum]|uniref:Uncharacterized protein n=1 Tax=Symbiodinium pilosum TaxID=2952 RepID=A0A812WXM3_SYMPI|nr:unnamed protein product [Symbiodinium pilosum]
MIVETAQLLCNVHHRSREKDAPCDPPYTKRDRIPYKESAAGHRKLGSMIWVAESLGNYRWAVRLGLALCREYNRGRGRAKGKRTQHRTQAAAVCGWKWISCKREALEKLGIRRDQLWGVYAGFPYS